jgi:lipopolysaccharide export system permease protein
VTIPAADVSVNDRGGFEGMGRQTAMTARMRLFGGRFFIDISVLVLAVMSLIEAIFLAERFTIVFRDAAEKDANLFDIFLILSCTSTEIFDLALAIAVLMAVYMTLLQKRENRELLALFAAGSGPFQLISLALSVALGAQIISISVSGFLDPASRYAQRVLLLNAEVKALKTGISTGQFYYFPNYVAFAPDQGDFEQNESYLSAGQAAVPFQRAKKTPKRRLFLYEQVGPDMSRVITADRAHLDGPDGSGTITLKLTGFAQHTLADTTTPPEERLAAARSTAAESCPGCPALPQNLPRVGMNVRNVTERMNLNALLPFPPRGTDPVEQTLVDQIASSHRASASDYRASMELLGERVTRSLLCLLAPLIAMLALSFTSRRTSYIALPLGCMVLMTLNLTGVWLVKTLEPVSPLGAVGPPILLTAVILAASLTLVSARQSAIVRPGLARA